MRQYSIQENDSAEPQLVAASRTLVVGANGALANRVYPTPAITLANDRMGRRVTKNDRRFVYDGYLQIAELEESADDILHSPFSILHSYVWDPTEPVATRPLVWRHGDETRYYTHGGNKNVSEVVDAVNAIAAHYDYAPFGALTVALGTSAAANPWRFSSEYGEKDLDLVYYKYRHYESELGKWLRVDPRDEPGFSLTVMKIKEDDHACNSYLFCRNASVGSIDTLGLRECCCKETGKVIQCDGHYNRNGLISVTSVAFPVAVSFIHIELDSNIVDCEKYHLSATAMMFAMSLGLPFTATTSSVSFGDYSPGEFSGVVMFVSAGAALMGGGGESALRIGSAVSAGLGLSIGFDGSVGGDIGGCIQYDMRQIRCTEW